MRTTFIACPANVFQSTISPTAYKIFPSKKTWHKDVG